MTLRLIQAVIRHGDRTPAFNAFAGTPQAAAMTAFWSARTATLPHASIAAAFPVRNPNNQAFDEASFPLQTLTELGARQARERGRRVRAAYGDAFRARPHAVDVAARASNYIRTQQSAINFLCGLLGVDVGDVTAGDGAGKPMVPIDVRPSARDSIAVFEAAWGLPEAVVDVYSQPIYTDREKELEDIARAFVASVPYFAPAAAAQEAQVVAAHVVATVPPQPTAPSVAAAPSPAGAAAAAPPPPPSTPPAAEAATTTAPPPPPPIGSNTAAAVARKPASDPLIQGSRFLWIRAYDLFITHLQHGAPLADAIREYEQLTHTHLLWRFRTLYSFPRILTLSAGPLLTEVLANMRAVMSADARMAVEAPPTAVRLTALAPASKRQALPAAAAVVDSAQAVERRHHRGTVLMTLLAGLGRYHAAVGHRHMSSVRKLPRAAVSLRPPPAGHGLAFRLFSGHDVTILPVVYALLCRDHAVTGVTRGGRHVAFPHMHAARLAVRWPEYASCFRFELLAPHAGSAGGSRRDVGWQVRWHWDNEPVDLDAGMQAAVPTGVAADDVCCVTGEMSVPDFEALVGDLRGQRLGWGASAS